MAGKGTKENKALKILGVSVDILFLLSSMKFIQEQFPKVHR